MESIKRKLSAALSALIMLSAVNIAIAEEQAPITVFIDGNQLSFDVDPIIENDRTLVPMRAIFEELDAKISWDAENRIVEAVKGDNTIVVTIDDNIMLKNGEEILLDTPARIIDDRTLVPVRAVSEGLEADVEWDKDGKKVIITTQEDESLLPENEPEVTGESLSASELSQEDMELLTEGNIIRYSFEQYYMPAESIENAEQVSELMRSDENKFTEYVNNAWYSNAAAMILTVQLESETRYEISEIDGTETIDVIKELYGNLLKEMDIMPEDMFTVTYKELEDDKKMALITFNDTDALLACKYIGIVADKNNEVRYFTAETDILDNEHLYFCEVNLEGRGSIGLMDFDEDSFVGFIETVYENGLVLNGNNSEI